MAKKVPPTADENPIGATFARFPEIKARQIAMQMGINYKLMHQYISGKKTPTASRAFDIERQLHILGEELLKVKF